MTQIMIDLETLSTSANSVIVSIGAVCFGGRGDDETILTGDFFTRVDFQSCLDAGMEVSAETIKWWLTQSREAIDKNFIDGDGLEIKDALIFFSNWIKKVEKSKGEITAVWGNGSMFDNTIIINSFNKAGIETPWPFWVDKCYRTVKEMHPNNTFERIGLYHDPVCDAASQANHLIKILKRINESN